MMKIINKILDNYYTQKLLERIDYIFIMRNLDYKFITIGNIIDIKVKNRKYDNKYYTSVGTISKCRAFHYLINMDDFITNISSRVDEYSKDNKVV